MKNNLQIICAITFIAFISGCYSDAKNNSGINTSNNAEFNNYWYQGKAELSSFTLKQARYGEIHEGEVVLIYVTEDFSASKQVKLDNPNSVGNDRVPMLKLNMSKKFNTGLYPYSILKSVFMPVDLDKHAHALKVSTSVQEWCGNAFYQINNKEDKFKISSKSYFETDGDLEFSLDKNYLEDELWNVIRLNSKKLPQGKIKIIPSTDFARLKHVELKAYEALANLESTDGDNMIYTITYPSLDRTFSIIFNESFPFQIQSWEEEYISGWGTGAKKLKTTAKLNKTLITDYWTKNSLNDLGMREELGLD